MSHKSTEISNLIHSCDLVATKKSFHGKNQVNVLKIKLQGNGLHSERMDSKTSDSEYIFPKKKYFPQVKSNV